MGVALKSVTGFLALATTGLGHPIASWCKAQGLRVVRLGQPIRRVKKKNICRIGYLFVDRGSSAGLPCINNDTVSR